jgi:hypothetical protein
MLNSIRRNALRSLIPPPRLQLSEWIETNIRLREGVSALPLAIRLYPYRREIADAGLGRYRGAADRASRIK